MVLFQIDAEKGEGRDLAKEFNVKVFPTFVMVNDEGVTADRWAGYNKRHFIKILADAVTDLSTIDVKMAAYEREPTARLAAVLGRYSSAMRNYGDAVDYYSMAQKLNREPSQDYTYEIFKNTYYGSSGEKFTFEDILAAADQVIDSGNADPQDVVSVSLSVIGVARKNDRLDVIEPYIETGLRIAEKANDPEAKDAYYQLMIEKSLHITGDKKAAVEYKRATMPEGWMDDAGQLNSFAWWCFENMVNLEEAERLSRKSVELAEPGRQKAMNLDTLAEIRNALGNRREAVDLIKMAIQEDPDNEYYKEQLEKFENNLASQE